jgi:polysaccharide biosynthesis/export protein
MVFQTYQRAKAFAMRASSVGLVLLVTGCTNPWMPVSGPQSWDIESGRNLEIDGLAFGYVKLTPEIVQTLLHIEPRGLAGAFTDRRAVPEQTFQVGDVVSVTIFEAAAGGLFIPSEAGVRPGNFVQLPEQTVDSAGNISVPYAGAIPTRGRTPEQVQRDIIDRLRNRAIEPQVVVALTRQNGGLVSVLGEVNLPARFAPTPAGDRVLDAITRAGGIKGQGWETLVTLERAGRRQTVPFVNLVDYPVNNINVMPLDNIYVYRQPQTFLAFGATGQQGQFNFDNWRISLAEAVAKAGGLLDAQADPAATFLYRPMPRDIAEALGIDVSRFNTTLVPVIFNVNLRDPAGYFLATQVRMRDKDVLYISNAAAVEIVKVFNFIRSFMATVSDTANAGSDVLIFRTNIKNVLRR